MTLRAQAPAAATSEIVADRITHNSATGETILEGNAHFNDGALLLVADELRSNNETGVVTAAGNVVLTRGEMRLLADRLVYTRANGSFTANNIRLGAHPYFVEGASASGSRDEITVKQARATYGEPGPWQPTVTADTIVYAPGKQLRSENASVGIGHAQPVPIPKFDHKIGAPFFGSATLTGGFRRSLGLFADASLQVPVSSDVRLGADLGIYTSRGLMFGPSGRYANPEKPEDLNGYFRSGYINDHGDKKTDILGRPIPEDRAFAEWQHRQKIGDNLTLNVQLNWWKDSEVLRDFRPRAFFPVQEPDTFVESVYTGENYFVSAFARFQPNSFHRVQQRLPEFRFDLLPTKIGNGFYERFNASFAVLREESVADGRFPAFLLPLNPVQSILSPSAVALRDGGPDRRSTRFDAYYSIERPLPLGDWFAFTPLAGARFTHYAQPKESRLLFSPVVNSPPALPVRTLSADLQSLGAYSRTLGELGFDAALRTSGTFDYKNEQWKIDGLRHLFTPRLSYRYIPEADKGLPHIPLIDRQTFNTYLPPLGLGDRRNLDDLRATNTLRLSLDNILQTRDRTQGTRDLVAFNVANDFRFKRAPGERDVSEIHTDASVTPARWLQLDLYQSFAPRNLTLREFNSSFTLRDGRAWSVRFGNNFLSQQLQDYSVDARVRINERYEALSRLRYDARKRRFNEQEYGVSQNLGNTWLISYSVSVYSGRKRESNFGLNVQIDTVRF